MGIFCPKWSGTWFHSTYSLYPCFGGFGKTFGTYQVKLGNYLVLPGNYPVICQNYQLPYPFLPSSNPGNGYFLGNFWVIQANIYRDIKSSIMDRLLIYCVNATGLQQSITYYKRKIMLLCGI